MRPIRNWMLDNPWRLGAEIVVILVLGYLVSLL